MPVHFEFQSTGKYEMLQEVVVRFKVHDPYNHFLQHCLLTSTLELKVHQTMLMIEHVAHNNRELTGTLHTESAIDTAHRLSVASMTPADTCLGSSAEVPTVAADSGRVCHLGAVCPTQHIAVFSLAQRLSNLYCPVSD